MIKDFFRKFSISLRKRRLLRLKKKKQIQTDISVISNNCIAGVMYSDFGLQFLTPTINLCFGGNRDFLNFVLDLEKYCTLGKLVKISESSRAGFKGAPIAALTVEGLPDVEIHFLHYKTFKEAQDSWHRRCERINFNKIFVVIEAQDTSDKILIKEYSRIPYPKIIFTDENFDFDCCLKMKFYEKYGVGHKFPIMKIVSIFGKRGYDDYDIINNIFCYNFEHKRTE